MFSGSIGAPDASVAAADAFPSASLGVPAKSSAVQQMPTAHKIANQRLRKIDEVLIPNMKTV
jgi:hypothetical protein